MSRYDRVLIAPSREQLDKALYEAVHVANDGRRQRLLHWPLPEREAFDEQMTRPHGWRQWNGGEGPARAGEGRSIGAAAWWSDRVGRKHVRVVGRSGHFSKALLANLFCPFGEPRPPLWFVYPDHIFLKRDSERRVACALCACGAFGTPEDLGWMGPCCDACHDRVQEGQRTANAWLDPRKATLHTDEGRLVFLAYAPDGLTLAAGTGREQVTLWNTATGAERGKLVGPAGEWVLGAGWSSDGETVVTGAANGAVRFWDARTCRERSFQFEPGGVDVFAVAPDCSGLVRGDRQHVRLLDGRTGAARAELPGEVTGLCCLAISSDGQRIATGSRGGDILLWDAKTPRLHGRTSRPGTTVAGLAFSPDGKVLAAALLPSSQGTQVEGGSITLCDTAGLESRGGLAGHTGGTRCVNWAPDGRFLASGGEDGTVRLWESASGRERVALEWHLDAVCAVAFAPDGLTLASGSFDGTAKLWPREVLRPLERQREPSPVAT
jgi:hypothetical protein